MLIAIELGYETEGIYRVCWCPFTGRRHSNERSLRCYILTETYECTMCGTSGDVPDFLSKLFNSDVNAQDSVGVFGALQLVRHSMPLSEVQRFWCPLNSGGHLSSRINA